MPEISIVVPMYNEAANLDALFARLNHVLHSITPDYEIVCVNDGSEDDTLSRLLTARYSDERIVVIDLARNFGKDLALTAGLDYARGHAVIPIDSDLQDPPELIPKMIKLWREGYEVVYAQRRSRAGETPLKLLTAGAFYKIMNRWSDVHIPENAGDYRLLDQRVVAVLRDLPERTRFMKGLFAWVGFRQAAVHFDREPRQAGRTKWNYFKLWRFALDGITSFTTAPLRVWTFLGGAIAIAAFVYLLFLFARTIMFGVDVPGYASLMVIILLFGGLHLLGIGILGEYIGRIFLETKQRPMYVVRRVYNHPSPE